MVSQKSSTLQLIRGGITRPEIRRQVIAQRKGTFERAEERRRAKEFERESGGYRNISEYEKGFGSLNPKVSRRVQDVSYIWQRQQQRISKVDEEIAQVEANIARFQEKRRTDRGDEDFYELQLAYSRARLRGLREGRQRLERGDFFTPQEISTYAGRLGKQAERERKAQQARSDAVRSLGFRSYYEYQRSKPTLEALERGTATETQVLSLPSEVRDKLKIEKVSDRVQYLDAPRRQSRVKDFSYIDPKTGLGYSTTPELARKEGYISKEVYDVITPTKITKISDKPSLTERIFSKIFPKDYETGKAELDARKEYNIAVEAFNKKYAGIEELPADRYETYLKDRARIDKLNQTITTYEQDRASATPSKFTRVTEILGKPAELFSEKVIPNIENTAEKNFEKAPPWKRKIFTVITDTSFGQIKKDQYDISAKEYAGRVSTVANVAPYTIPVVGGAYLASEFSYGASDVADPRLDIEQRITGLKRGAVSGAFLGAGGALKLRSLKDNKLVIRQPKLDPKINYIENRLVKEVGGKATTTGSFGIVSVQPARYEYVITKGDYLKARLQGRNIPRDLKFGDVKQYFPEARLREYSRGSLDIGIAPKIITKDGKIVNFAQTRSSGLTFGEKGFRFKATKVGRLSGEFKDGRALDKINTKGMSKVEKKLFEDLLPIVGTPETKIVSGGTKTQNIASYQSRESKKLLGSGRTTTRTELMGYEKVQKRVSREINEGIASFGEYTGRYRFVDTTRPRFAKPRKTQEFKGLTREVEIRLPDKSTEELGKISSPSGRKSSQEFLNQLYKNEVVTKGAIADTARNITRRPSRTVASGKATQTTTQNIERQIVTGAYAGLGTYERTTEVRKPQSLGATSRPSIREKDRQRDIDREISAGRTLTVGRQDLGLQNRNLNRELNKSLTREITRQDTRQIQKQNTRQITRQVTKQITKIPKIITRIPVIKPATILRPPRKSIRRPPFGRDKKEIKRKKLPVRRRRFIDILTYVPGFTAKNLGISREFSRNELKKFATAPGVSIGIRPIPKRRKKRR